MRIKKRKHVLEIKNIIIIKKCIDHIYAYFTKSFLLIQGYNLNLLINSQISKNHLGEVHKISFNS